MMIRVYAKYACVFLFLFSATFFITGTAFAGPNLVPNPSLETTSLTGDPENWFRGGWGTNTRMFTYPTVGIDGVKAAKVEITGYTDGDAKWYFADVPVAGGSAYAFTHQYNANVPTDIFVRYTVAGGGFQYQFIETLPITSGWAAVSRTITVPTNATSITIFHIIHSVGSLQIDNYNLSSDTPLPTSSNLIPNPSLETTDITGKKPASWTNNSWGNLQATFTYPVAGYQSNRAAEVTIKQRTSGDAKWYFNEVAVTPGARYEFSDMYRANVPTEIDVRFRLANGTNIYVYLATIPAVADWKAFTVSFTVPKDAVSATVFHLIARAGKLTVDEYKLTVAGDTTLPPPPPPATSGDFSEGMVSLVFDDGWQTSYDNALPILESHNFKATHYIITNTYKEGNVRYVTVAELLDLQKRGHEVAAHTRTHTDLTTLSGQALTNEVAGSRQDLLNLGISPVATFAYPYGSYNDTVIASVKNAGFSAARSIIPGLNFKKGTDTYLLKWQGPEITTTFADMRGWIDEAISKKGWLIISFHKINNSSDQYNTTPANLTAVADYLKTKNVRVITVADGVKMLGE